MFSFRYPSRVAQLEAKIALLEKEKLDLQFEAASAHAEYLNLRERARTLIKENQSLQAENAALREKE